MKKVMKTYVSAISVLFFFILLNCNKPTEFLTPLEKNNYRKLSEYSEMVNFFKECEKMNPAIKLTMIGKSTAGMEIPLLTITGNNSQDKKINVLVLAQQHGNEASGKEGLLMLIKEFAKNKDTVLLSKLNLIIIPLANPEGSEVFTRRNSKKIDLNRNHLLLTAPEVLAIHQIFDKIQPEVTLDMHEYYPFDDTTKTFKFVKNIDEQFDCITNLNVDSVIRTFAREKIVPSIIEAIKSQGYTSGEYTIGSYAENESYRNSTVDMDDGRQSFGLQQTFSFIVEGIRGKDTTENMERRSKAQYTAVKSLLQFVYDNKDQLLGTVAKARNQLVNQSAGQPFVARMEHYFGNKPMEIPMKSIRNGRDTIIKIDSFRSVVKPLQIIKKPEGYLVLKNDTSLVALIKRHGFIEQQFVLSDEIKIIQYEITSLKTDSLERQTSINPCLTLVDVTKKINLNNYLYIPVNQLKSNIIVHAFEPMSMIALENYDDFKYLIANKMYPILRIEKK
jgi:hypothetical protein